MRTDQATHHRGQRARIIHDVAAVQEVSVTELLAGEIGGHGDYLCPSRASAALTPAGESSIARHSSGSTPSSLLKQGESYDLTIRELLQALVTPTIMIDVLVDVVDRAEQNSEGLF